MITINPEQPTSDDNVVLGFYGSDVCSAREASRTTIGSQFIFTVEQVNPPCIVLAPPYHFVWSVGRLEVGEYQVIHNDPHFDEPATQAFSVSQGQLPFPTTAIPSLGIPAAILLAAALVWLANKAFKRTHERRVI